MEMIVLADDALKGLRPDPSWDVSGVRDMVGGIVAIALVLAVGAIILGCVSMVPGLVSNNMMERAFSWKRLLAACLVPFVIGAAVSCWGWSCNVFCTEGLTDNRGKGDDSLTDLVSQLGKDIAQGIGDSVKSAVTDAVKDAMKGWNWVTGGDGKGNVFQKAADGVSGAVSGVWNFFTGGGK